jgi:hypothetical protein
MKSLLPIVLSSLLLAGGSALLAQDPGAATTHPDTKMGKSKPDVSYGRVKELTAGQKVVIDVDNSIDKTFDLTDKDVAVKLASNLKVGDPVKITERSVAGKTKSVQITHHSGGGVSHGDKKSGAAENK